MSVPSFPPQHGRVESVFFSCAFISAPPAISTWALNLLSTRLLLLLLGESAGAAHTAANDDAVHHCLSTDDSPALALHADVHRLPSVFNFAEKVSLSVYESSACIN